MHSDVYHLKWWGAPGKKYIFALDTEQGEVTSESRSWGRFSGGHGLEFILEG